jgi:hypothetical protein
MPTMLPPEDISGSTAADSDFKEKALVSKAALALSAGAVMNAPPRASWGANAMAWSTPSTSPHCSRSDSVRASRSSPLLTSSSSTSTGSGSRWAARSVIRRARPKLVSSTVAPSCCARSAAWKAIESLVMTPVMSRRLPARITADHRPRR